MPKPLVDVLEKVAGREFQKQFRRLKIIDPVTFLKEIEQIGTP